MSIFQIENTIDIWINALDHYDLEVLRWKPGAESWSLGQVYLHVLHETDYYIEQVEYCLAHRENVSETMSDFAARLFSDNGFPDERIQGDPQSSSVVPQPESKMELMEQMIRLKELLVSLIGKVEHRGITGKTKHPGLGYFDAKEWLEFAEMHMRHHLRQKDRIEAAII